MTDRYAKPGSIVVGGGFAGVGAARELAKHDDVEVTLVDRNNYHQFQPLLYQVATSMLAAPDIAYPLRKVAREHRNFNVTVGEVTAHRPDDEDRDDWPTARRSTPTTSSWPPAPSRTSSTRRAPRSTPSRSTRSTTRRGCVRGS